MSQHRAQGTPSCEAHLRQVTRLSAFGLAAACAQLLRVCPAALWRSCRQRTAREREDQAWVGTTFAAAGSRHSMPLVASLAIRRCPQLGLSAGCSLMCRAVQERYTREHHIREHHTVATPQTCGSMTASGPRRPALNRSACSDAKPAASIASSVRRVQLQPCPRTPTAGLEARCSVCSQLCCGAATCSRNTSAPPGRSTRLASARAAARSDTEHRTWRVGGSREGGV